MQFTFATEFCYSFFFSYPDTLINYEFLTGLIYVLFRALQCRYRFDSNCFENHQKQNKRKWRFVFLFMRWRCLSLLSNFFRVFIWERDPICVRFKLIESQCVRVWLNYMNDDFSNKLIYSFFCFQFIANFFRGITAIYPYN